MQRYMSLPTVAVLAILVYIVFFGESSVTQRIEYQRQIDSLSAEVAVVQDSVDYYRELNRRLASEPRTHPSCNSRRRGCSGRSAHSW